MVKCIAGAQGVTAAEGHFNARPVLAKCANDCYVFCNRVIGFRTSQLVIKTRLVSVVQAGREVSQVTKQVIRRIEESQIFRIEEI